MQVYQDSQKYLYFFEEEEEEGELETKIDNLY